MSQEGVDHFNTNDVLTAKERRRMALEEVKKIKIKIKTMIK